MNSSLITINLVVLNGEKYIRHCLDSVLAQTYPHELIELNILDNGSVDKTKEVIHDLEFRISDLGFAKFNLIESKLNGSFQWNQQSSKSRCKCFNYEYREWSTSPDSTAGASEPSHCRRKTGYK